MKKFLLPFKFKVAGISLIGTGVLLTVGYFWFDFRIMLPVFAVVSSFLEIKMFAIFKNNVADELILLLFLAGFYFVMFSKEKIESEELNSFRCKALVKAVISNNIFLLFSFLFIFGSGFIAIIVLNLFSLPFFYLFFFSLLKREKVFRL
jgi:hypothetical protein